MNVVCQPVNHHNVTLGVRIPHFEKPWAKANPHAIRRTNFQQRFSVDMWAGIVNRMLIGPYILLQMLRIWNSHKTTPYAIGRDTVKHPAGYTAFTRWDICSV